MRTRLRPLPTADELERIYARPHDHRRFGAGHDIRARLTAALGTWMVLDRKARSIVDLSTGNGWIPNEMVRSVRDQLQVAPTLVLGDVAARWPVCGAIEDTIRDPAVLVAPRPRLLVLSETLEHLDDPDAVLATSRQLFDCLLLSTPTGEEHDANPEHLWGWDTDGLGEMLEAAGWTAMSCVTTEALADPVAGYSYQIWGCR